MSRPASRKGRNAKQKPKTPKVIIKELTEQNEQLTQELAISQTEVQELRKTLQALSAILVNNCKNKRAASPGNGSRRVRFDTTDQPTFLTAERGISPGPQQRPVTPQLPDGQASPALSSRLTAPAPLVPSASALVDMLEQLVVKRRVYDVSVEARVEELEETVTRLSMQLARASKKALAFEQGLLSVSECRDFYQVKDKVCELQLIAGQQYNSFDAEEPDSYMQVNGNLTDVILTPGRSPDTPSDLIKQEDLNIAHTLNLVPPSKKLPPETPVRVMHGDLRLYVIRELSREKPSGSDWRMFGKRVGIDESLINQWHSRSLAYPMARVLEEWDKMDGSTVRMLHRHLMSPQLRLSIVGKRIADFYGVT